MDLRNDFNTPHLLKTCLTEVHDAECDRYGYASGSALSWASGRPFTRVRALANDTPLP